VIGACLLNNQMVSEGCTGLMPEHFGTSLLAVAWRLIQDWCKTGVHFDEEDLQRALEKRKYTVEASVIAEWMIKAEPAGADRCRRRTREIIELYQRRQIEKSASRTLEEVTDRTISIDNIKRRIDRDLQVISECSELPVANALNPEEGSQLLADLMLFLQTYVRLSEDGYLILAPWILHTHAFAAWTRTPYLHVSSATPECGKTLLLELLELLVPNPLLIMGVSVAALARAIEQDHPVLLLDEVDQYLAGDRELLAAIMQTINSGYKKSGNRLVPEPSKDGGRGWVTRKLNTFCPKVLSGISGLPLATASRCIPIDMQRMLPTDRVKEKHEYITEPEAKVLFQRCQVWGKANLKALSDARPDAPAALGHRQREVSGPLLAVAGLAGDGWGMRLRGALLRVFAARAAGPDDNVKIQVLHDLEDVFDHKQKMPSEKVAQQLAAIAGSPWASWGKQQKPINQT
jgi:hypothetical protein